MVHDAHLNREKTGPLPVAEYSVLLMRLTEGQCYSVAELEAAVSEVGFVNARLIPTTAHRSLFAASKPA